MLDTFTLKRLDVNDAAHYHPSVHYKFKLLSLIFLAPFIPTAHASETGASSFALVPFGGSPLASTEVLWCEKNAVMLDPRLITENAIFRLSFEGPKVFLSDDDIRRENRRPFWWRTKQRLRGTKERERNLSIQDQISSQQNTLLHALSDPLLIPGLHPLLGGQRVPEGSFSFNIQNANDSLLMNLIKNWHSFRVWDPIDNKIVVVHASVTPLLKFLVARGVNLETKPSLAKQSPIELALEQHDIEAVLYLASVTKVLPAGFYDSVVASGWSTNDLQRLPPRVSPSVASLRLALTRGDGDLFRFIMERGAFADADLQRLVKEISGHTLDGDIMRGLESRPFDATKAKARLAVFTPSSANNAAPSLRVFKLIDFKIRLLRYLANTKHVELNTGRIDLGDRWPGVTAFELAIANQDSEDLNVEEFSYMGRVMAYFFSGEGASGVVPGRLLSTTLRVSPKGYYNLQTIHIVLEHLRARGQAQLLSTDPSLKDLADTALRIGAPIKSVLGVFADLGLRPSSASLELFFSKVSKGRRADAFDAGALRELFDIYPNLQPSDRSFADAFRTGRYQRRPRPQAGKPDPWTAEQYQKSEIAAVAQQLPCLQVLLAHSPTKTAAFVREHPEAVHFFYTHLNKRDSGGSRPVSTTRLPLIKLVISRFGMDYNATNGKGETLAYRALVHHDFETLRYLLTLPRLDLKVPAPVGDMLYLATQIGAPADILEELRHR